MSSFIQKLQVKQLKLVAKGSGRLVYQHPTNSSWLIKIHRPYKAEPHASKYAFLKKYFKHKYEKVIFHRELLEFMKMKENNDIISERFADIIGFVDTDIGLGTIVEAIKSEDDTLAPTLSQMLKNKTVTKETKHRLIKLFEMLRVSNVVVGDLNAANIVLHNKTDFIIIDGLGDKTLIPIRKWSRWINQKGYSRKLRKLSQNIDHALGKTKTTI